MIDLNIDTPIKTLVETALRAHIDHDRSLQTNTTPSFGASIVAFREKHNISKMDIDPDEIWGDIRDV